MRLFKEDKLWLTSVGGQFQVELRLKVKVPPHSFVIKNGITRVLADSLLNILGVNTSGIYNLDENKMEHQVWDILKTIKRS